MVKSVYYLCIIFFFIGCNITISYVVLKYAICVATSGHLAFIDHTVVILIFLLEDIIYSRMSMIPANELQMYELKAEEWLVKCFHADPKFVDIAAADGDILESIYKGAKATYDDEMKKD